MSKKRRLYPMPAKSRSQHFNVTRMRLAGERAVSFPCRCRHRSCEARATLPRHPSHYVIAPKCKGCGRCGTMRVDWYRIAKEWGVRPCRCLAYTFPHLRGRGYCEHNPAITAEHLRERWERRITH